MRAEGPLDETGAFEDGSQVPSGLAQQDFKSDAFSFYMRSPSRDTYSLCAFIEDLLLDDAIPRKDIKRILNPKDRTGVVAPFWGKDQLEEFAFKVHADLKYAGGPVPLDVLCEAERQRTDLQVHLAVEPTPDAVERQILGRIDFRERQIYVYDYVQGNAGRARFTLAHELAHYLLEHGKFLRREWCDASDFALARSSSSYGANVARMEFQANYFAACLLLPRNNVVGDFHKLIAGLDIPNRGFGSLYVDDQPCNRLHFDIVTNHFTTNYGVSKTAAAIRLRSLNLLRDARTNLGSRRTPVSLRDAIFEGANSIR